MAKYKWLYLILVPFFAALLLIAFQQLIIAGYSNKHIPDDMLYLGWQASHVLLMFICACLTLGFRSRISIRPNKRLIVLFGALVVIHAATLLVFHFALRRPYSNMESVIYSFIAMLLAASFTVKPEKSISMIIILLMALGYIIIWLLCIFLSTVMRIGYQYSPPKISPVMVMSLYMGAIILFGAMLGIISNRDIYFEKHWPVVIVSALYTTMGLVYIVVELVSFSGMAKNITQNAIVAIIDFIRSQDKIYLGFAQLVIYLGCWYGTLLFFTLKNKRPV